MTSVQMSASCVCSWMVAQSEPLGSELVLYTLCTFSFINNYTDGQTILVSASSTGNLAIWDLNEGGRLLHMVRGAHDGAISAAEWVPHQPLLITSGEDNSVKVVSTREISKDLITFT